MASACNPTDEVESPTDLQPSAETVAKNTPIAKFLVKAGYLYLIALNLTVLFYDNVPISLQVLSTSIVCIVLGSFGSLRHPESAEAQEVERLKPKDAYMFPVFGSMALCSFYLAIKYLPAWIIDLAAQLFFTVLSAFASQSLFEELALEFFPGFLYSLFDVQIVTFIVKWKCIAGKPVIPMISVGPSTTKKTNNKNEDVIDVKLLNIVTLLIDTPALGARVVYGYERENNAFYYASYNSDNTERCKKDLSLLNMHEEGWKAGDVIRVGLNIAKGKIKFYLNDKQVRKTISIEKSENCTYYPVVFMHGNGEYKI
eukprot:189282_1